MGVMCALCQYATKANCLLAFTVAAHTLAYMAEACKEKGNAHVKSGEYQAAREAYSQGIVLDPTNHVLYSNRAHANAMLKLPHLAAADALRCLELKPEWTKAHYRLAQAYMSMEGFRKAAEALQKGLQYAKGATKGEFEALMREAKVCAIV